MSPLDRRLRLCAATASAAVTAGLLGFVALLADPGRDEPGAPAVASRPPAAVPAAAPTRVAEPQGRGSETF